MCQNIGRASPDLHHPEEESTRQMASGSGKSKSREWSGNHSGLEKTSSTLHGESIIFCGEGEDGGPVESVTYFHANK